MQAVPLDAIEHYRALMPRGFRHAADVYRQACAQLTTQHLSEHYTSGRAWFTDTFVPHVKCVLERLSGGVWNLSDYVGFAAGSDVDLMTHIIETSSDPVVIYPGDWGGFLVGASRAVQFSRDGRGALACICVPSVRNGLFTEDMEEFWRESRAALLNLNLFPTLPLDERREVARWLSPHLPKCLISVSFSRGFSLTVSQFGLLLVHPDHPELARSRSRWEWFSYFYNGLAASAFMHMDLNEVERVHGLRRSEVAAWHARAGMPYEASGSYYVKAFRIQGELPPAYSPLMLHDGLLRLCFKPDSE